MEDIASETFGQRNFAGVDLGDARRTKRLVALTDKMVSHPGGTLPNKLSHPPDLRAFYRLMDQDESTHERLMNSHTTSTRRAMAEAASANPGSVFLIVHDATELDYTTLQSVANNLGQIGEGTHRGYICHNSLIIQAQPQMVLGLGSQILHHRANVPEGETDKQRREREDRESRLWVWGASQCGAAPPGSLCVDISDRLSDTFEYMAFEVSQKRHFVLRARENRKLATQLNGESYLFDAVRRQPAVTTRKMSVQASEHHKARTAKLSVSFVQVEIAEPGKRSGEYTTKSLVLWAVRVWEANPPRGAERLEWILLTNMPVTDKEAAEQKVEWYEHRPIVEEYHKCMKTGCGVETLQFTTIARLEPAIAVLSVLAITLLRLRDAARQPDADVRPATDVVGAEYVRVLQAYYPRRLRRTPTVKEFFMHVARLGGHQNRKCDGMPGWLTLWRGWMKLELILIGHQLKSRRDRKKRSKCGKT
jgi:hypothetical protein